MDAAFCTRLFLRTFLKAVPENRKSRERDLGRGLDCKTEPFDRLCGITRRFARHIRQIISIHRKASRAERSDASNYRQGFSALAAAVYASNIDPLPGISGWDWCGDSAGQLYLSRTVAQITRYRPKLLCCVYGYLTLIPISWPDWISPIASARNVYLTSAFWTWEREIGVSVPYTYQPPCRALHANFIKYLPGAKYEVYASLVTARAHFHALPRERVRNNRITVLLMYPSIFLNKRPWQHRVIRLIFEDFYRIFVALHISQW